MDQLEDAIVAQLNAIDDIETSAPGGVVNTMRPQGGAWPVVAIRRALASVDQQTFSGPGIESHTYDVQCIAPAADSAGLGPLYDEVHAALERQHLDLGDSYTHLQTLRSGRIPSFPEVVDGVAYRRTGGTYSIWTAAVS